MKSIHHLNPEDIELFQGNTTFIEELLDEIDIDVPHSEQQYEGFLPEWL